jgi:hypothetical protein
MKKKSESSTENERVLMEKIYTLEREVDSLKADMRDKTKDNMVLKEKLDEKNNIIQQKESQMVNEIF